MRSSEQIKQAVNELAQHYPHDKITFADVARTAGLHWTTVRRHFGSKEAMRDYIRRNAQNPSIADTRTRILSSARRVFAKLGYDGATLDLIAQEADMTKGAVYWHFSSKSDLFLALCEQSLEQLQRRLPQQVEGVLTADDPVEALRLLLESEFESCEVDGGERPLLFFEFISNIREPEIRDQINAAFTKLIQNTAQLLEDLQRRNLISAHTHPHELAVTIHALINGAVLMWLVAPDQVSFQSLADEVSKMLWQGIRPDSGYMDD